MNKGVFAAACFLFAARMSFAAVDQSQTGYDGGMSTRNVAGYSVYQTFTAGITGTLSSFTALVQSDRAGTLTLKVYSGAGVGGALLGTFTAAISKTVLNPDQASWVTGVPVVSGSVYTAQIINTDTFDPECLFVSRSNAYPGGKMFLVDPGGTYDLGWDIWFKTTVN